MPRHESMRRSSRHAQCLALVLAGGLTVSLTLPHRTFAQEHLPVPVDAGMKRAIHPLTGTNWEGVGVKPDVETTAAEAFAVACRLAR